MTLLTIFLMHSLKAKFLASLVIAVGGMIIGVAWLCRGMTK